MVSGRLPLRLPLNGNDIQRVRKDLALTARELGTVLGVNRATIYKWEADGFYKAHTDAAAVILKWLIALPQAEIERWSRIIRERLAKKRVVECQLELTLAVLTVERAGGRIGSAASPGSQIAPPQVASPRSRAS